jgi:hypothetical protein
MIVRSEEEVSWTIIRWSQAFDPVWLLDPTRSSGARLSRHVATCDGSQRAPPPHHEAKQPHKCLISLVQHPGMIFARLWGGQSDGSLRGRRSGGTARPRELKTVAGTALAAATTAVGPRRVTTWRLRVVGAARRGRGTGCREAAGG